MRLAFVVRSLFFQKPSFTTIHLAREAQRGGHEVFFISLNGFSWTPDGPIADAVRPGPSDSPMEFLGPLRQESPPSETLRLGDISALFFRFNPFHPEFSEDLIQHPALHIASELEQQGIGVINSPRALSVAASKAYVLRFPESVRPRTLVSRNPARIKNFLSSLGGPAIVKPLAGSGGRHVFYVDSAEDVNLNSMLSAVRGEGYVLAQQYLPGGQDKRVLLWQGKVLEDAGQPAVFQRVSPKGEFRSNMQLGATRRATSLTDGERRVLETVGNQLARDGIQFAGVDLVGERLLEVNVFCPGGIQNCNDLYGANFGAAIVSHLQGKQTPEAQLRELNT